MFSLDALFCHVDDLCKIFEAQWQKKRFIHGGIKRIRAKGKLHQVFKNSNVKLKKSREFFDLYLWQMAYLY